MTSRDDIVINHKTGLPELPQDWYWHVKWYGASLEWYELQLRRRVRFFGIQIGWRKEQWHVMKNLTEPDGAWRHVKRDELTSELILENAIVVAVNIPSLLKLCENERLENINKKQRIKEIDHLLGSYPPKKIGPTS